MKDIEDWSEYIIANPKRRMFFGFLAVSIMFFLIVLISIDSNTTTISKDIVVKKIVEQENGLNNLKWITKTIVEKNNRDLHKDMYLIDIDVEYPQFIGGDEVDGINKYVEDIVISRIDKDKKSVNDFDLDNSRFDEIDARLITMISLKIEYKVTVMTNDIVGIELMIISKTGGRSGDYEDPGIFLYDLKSDKAIETDDVFCIKDHQKILPPYVFTSIYSDISNLYAKIEKDNGVPKIVIYKKDSSEVLYTLNEKLNGDARESLSSFRSIRFSLDGSKIYFLSWAWTTSFALHEWDFKINKVRFITDSNDYILIPKGKYQGKMLVLQHKYFLEGGSYDWYWLIDPVNGKLFEDSPVMNKDMFLYSYVCKVKHS